MFELHELVFREHIDRLWGWDEPWQRSRFVEECQEGTSCLLLHDDRFIGYVQTQQEEERLRLANIAIHPEYQGRGVGTRFVRDLQCCAVGSQVPILLKVFTTNPDAQRFYERLGFYQTGRDAKFVSMRWVPWMASRDG